MKMKLLAAALLASSGVAATEVAADQKSALPDNNPNQINVSCYRGAFRSVVAWDRANGVFIEDLVQLGYTYPEAHAMGARVCRDERGIGNGEYKIQLLLRLMQETPPT